MTPDQGLTSRAADGSQGTPAAGGSSAPDAVLALVSHELRTPLNGVLGFSRLLLADDGIAPDRRQRYLRHVVGCAEHLLRQIDTLLWLAHGRAASEPSGPQPLTQAVQAQLDRVDAARRVRQVGIDVLFQCRSTQALPCPGWLGEIVFQLLDNAVKFSAPGDTVSLRAGTVGDDRLELQVLDRGVGVAAHEREKIFEPFHQVDAGQARSYPGLGIGLALVRRLVHAHGGGVDVAERAGGGSSFRVLLPLASLARPVGATPWTPITRP